MMMYVSGTVEKLPSRRVEEEEEEEDDRSSGPLLFPVSLLAAVPLWKEARRINDAPDNDIKSVSSARDPTPPPPPVPRPPF